MTDFIANSSVKTIQDFIGGTLHVDYIAELDCRIEDLRNVLEAGGNDEMSPDKIRGALVCARLMKDIFTDLAENKITSLNTERGE